MILFFPLSNYRKFVIKYNEIKNKKRILHKRFSTLLRMIYREGNREINYQVTVVMDLVYTVFFQHSYQQKLVSY